MSKVHTSAVCIIPPQEVWTKIQAIRQRHDKSFRRWMPHINLLYPFLPEKDFPNAASKLRSALGDFPQFKVVFNEFGFFEHGKRSCTLFLEPVLPQDKNILTRLQRELEGEFPNCKDLSERGNGTFHGHLTLGQFQGRAALDRKKAEFNRTWQPIEFTVDKIHLIARSGINPFKIIESVDLSYDEGRNLEEESKKRASQRSNDWNSPNTSTLGEPAWGNEAQAQKEPEQTALKIDEVDPEEKNRRKLSPEALVRKRVRKWLRTQSKRNKLPKTTKALASSIRPFCHVKTVPIEADEILNRLLEEKFIKYVKDEKNPEKQKVQYLMKGEAFDCPPSPFDDETEAEECYDRCRVWVMNPSNTPRSPASLQNCLKQLCIVTKLISPDTIVGQLEDAGLIKTEPYESNVTYQ